jgi:hypothetical protein
VNSALRGGSLRLEGYLWWGGTIVPKENNGDLIRIRGTSSGFFDRTFMDYQVSEQTRLRQIISELFVVRGLDAALNIDRESFNYAHPHVQLVASWMHRAIRQLTNRHKELTKRIRDTGRAEQLATARDAIEQHGRDTWERRHREDEPPHIELSDSPSAAHTARSSGVIAIETAKVPSLPKVSKGAVPAEWQAKVKALAQVLAAYNVMEDRSFDEQQELIDAIIRIFSDSKS